jgi:phospholipid transport system substrate-binding protein
MKSLSWTQSMKSFLRGGVGLLAVAVLSSGAARAQEPLAPDALIKAVSSEVIDAAKADKSLQTGELQKVIVLVDSKVMPHVNFERMTIATVGARHWKTATDAQKKRLLEEYKTLLLRTYAGALSMVSDQTVQVSPFKSAPADTEVLVRTKVRGGAEPVQLDYRLEKTEQGWKIYDVNVAGFWLTDQFRSSWAQEISANGLDGLISSLSKRNKAASGKG